MLEKGSNRDERENIERRERKLSNLNGGTFDDFSKLMSNHRVLMADQRIEHSNQQILMFLRSNDEEGKMKG